MVGGLFFHNYASGTGLMSGATFGRLAGRCAAQFTLAGVSSDRAAQV
jgi:tricarballylate dehydrogenase